MQGLKFGSKIVCRRNMISFACRVLTEHITTYWKILRFIFTRVLEVLQWILWETHLFSLFKVENRVCNGIITENSFIQMYSLCAYKYTLVLRALYFTLFVHRSISFFMVLRTYTHTHTHIHANKRILIHKLKWNLQAPTQQNEDVWVRMHTEMYLETPRQMRSEREMGC